MPKLAIPEVLPVSPLSLFSPLCGAKPGKDCRTLGGLFAVVHVARVKAAAVLDAESDLKRASRSFRNLPSNRANADSGHHPGFVSVWSLLLTAPFVLRDEGRVKVFAGSW